MSVQKHLARIRSGALGVPQELGRGILDSVLDRQYCSQSWKRCLDSGLSPDERAVIPVVEASEVRRLQMAFGEQAFEHALNALNGLMNLVCDVGYQASLANADGVIIAESIKPSQAFYSEGDRIGSIWSEQAGGTNGIGTCIAEQRPIAVFRDDHFHYDLASQACVAAPFYNPDGELQGVLNLTTCNPTVDLNAHQIVYRLATQSSNKLEQRLFRMHFEKCFIIQVCATTALAAWIAVDGGGVILGATQGARRLLGLQEAELGRRKLWEVIDCPQSAISLEIFRTVASAQLLHSPQRLDFLLIASPEQQSRTVEVERGTTRQRSAPEVTGSLARCAGQDTQMKDNVRLIRKVINKNLPLLLLGETGVGKDTLAKAIHQESDRSRSPFIAFNCASIPESLIDSELFGYSKGAFTGASKEGSQGRFMEADGGTLFLDEIGDMPLALQTRLLRVLESGEVSPLGGGKAVRVDVQIIAATNQRLHEKVAAGEFREDLFFRLAGMIIDLPPLREREDKAQLIEVVLQGVCGDEPTPTLKSSAWKKLLSYSWPGNVRELRHVLHRAALFAEGGEVKATDIVLPFENRIRPITERMAMEVPTQLVESRKAEVAQDYIALDDASDVVIHVTGVNARTTLDQVEAKAISQALTASCGSVDQACKALGMSKATLYRKLKRYGIRQ
ncbi:MULTISPECIES: sigma-54-dependent Fis family transcriptional regulator [Pseudomonas]|uniref:sigma-54-dependent Fis family transcriptional regulator n=1 Tax=Pseudomonas TaxID=286 RepID=UPI0008635C90|nr:MULTISPECIES: sigma-54-dependent Fis family transcriptional regulator [Pseudomonas]MDG9889976.1 sigma-54-dependent Fis family transcriptional regulator [Pseudomonas juntendi]QOH70638.1 sigma-54-dependent Fis family transcriptional regulator [Pseudomonas putida]RFQ03445.1 sigma-54-dependent Fis family transcriptional regulator [Pseudomonas putida]